MWYGSARARAILNDSSGAIADYSVYLAANPTAVNSLNARALLHYRLGSYEEAIADFSAYMKHEHTKAFVVEATLNRAMAYESKAKVLQHKQMSVAGASLDPALIATIRQCYVDATDDFESVLRQGSASEKARAQERLTKGTPPIFFAAFTL